MTRSGLPRGCEDVPAAAAAARELDPIDREVLDIEHMTWRWQASKEDYVRQTLGITAVRYHQILNRLLDDPLALAYAPSTVNRLRRLRDERRGRRGPYPR